MDDYQKRVFEEKKELDIKINSLTSFLFSDKSINLKIQPRNLLQEQLNIMLQYSIILGRRTDLFV